MNDLWQILRTLEIPITADPATLINEILWPGGNGVLTIETLSKTGDARLDVSFQRTATGFSDDPQISIGLGVLDPPLNIASDITGSGTFYFSAPRGSLIFTFIIGTGESLSASGIYVHKI